MVCLVRIQSRKQEFCISKVDKRSFSVFASETRLCIMSSRDHWSPIFGYKKVIVQTVKSTIAEHPGCSIRILVLYARCCTVHVRRLLSSGYRFHHSHQWFIVSFATVDACVQ